MKLIKESPFHNVWQATEGNVFGFNGEYSKYLVVDLRDGGKTALHTNSLVEAITWEPEFTAEGVMGRALLTWVEEFGHKNTDFNRQYNMDVAIRTWNDIAKMNGRREFTITETFTRRQTLANKFAEIYEAL